MKRKFGLAGRLMATYILLVAIGVGVFVIRYGWISQDGRVAEFEHAQQLRASLISTSLASDTHAFVQGATPPDALYGMVDQLVGGADGRLTLLDARGAPIYDTQFPAERIANQWQQIEVQTALARRAEYDIRVDPLSGDERLYVAAPVQFEGQVLGVLQLSVPTSAMWAAIRQAWMSLLVTALVAMAVATAIGLALVQSVLRPIHTLRQAAVRMAAGDLDQDITNAGGDETDDVVRVLEAMEVRMEDLVQRQKDFVANASHQLRTPLTTIKLRVEALVGGARNDEAVASRFLTEIEGEVDRLSHLVDELLMLSRVEAGIEPLKMERVNLALVLGQAVVAFHPRAEAAGVTLTLDTAPGLQLARASASHVRQVMDNLLDNALKHTPTGGLVTVSCRLVNGLLAVFVTDSGRGIPAQDLPHVFDRFYRGRSRSRAATGSGLGLAIVRSIIEAHGGEVTLESQEGKGTSVRFTLPALEQQSV